jgi:hypothetical protein
MGPFVLSNQIDLGKIPYVRKAMYRGGSRLYTTEKTGLKFYRDVVVFFSNYQGD